MPLYFHFKNPETSWLSNFSPHGFTLDRVRWRSVEHYYQSRKYPGTAAEKAIRDSPTAEAARKAGRNRSLTPRADWEEVKGEVMRAALQAKFRQNRRLLEMLLATDGEELVHESSRDLVWGRAKDGNGENLLGLMLMELRAELKQAQGDAS